MIRLSYVHMFVKYYSVRLYFFTPQPALQRAHRHYAFWIQRRSRALGWYAQNTSGGKYVDRCILPCLLQALCEVFRQPARHDRLCRLLFIIGNTQKIYAHPVRRNLNQRNACSRIAILRLANAAGIDEYLVFKVFPIRLVYGRRSEHLRQFFQPSPERTFPVYPRTSRGCSCAGWHGKARPSCYAP